MLIEIENFQGEYPRVGEQALPANAATEATNPRLLSGNITAWQDIEIQPDAVCKEGELNTIYLMEDDWLQWTDGNLGDGQTHVSVAKSPVAQDTTNRVVFTGTDVPRVTNKALSNEINIVLEPKVAQSSGGEFGGGTANPKTRTDTYFNGALPDPGFVATGYAFLFVMQISYNTAPTAGQTSRFAFAIDGVEVWTETHTWDGVGVFAGKKVQINRPPDTTPGTMTIDSSFGGVNSNYVLTSFCLAGSPVYYSIVPDQLVVESDDEAFGVIVDAEGNYKYALNNTYGWGSPTELCLPTRSYKLGVPPPCEAPTVDVVVPEPDPNEVSGTANLGAESGSTTGWSTSGDFVVKDNNDVMGLLPQTGSFFFAGGTAATTEAWQTITLADASLSQGQTLNMTWWQAAGANGSTVEAQLIFFDDLSIAIGDPVSSGAATVTPANTWVQKSLSGLVIPDGAVSFQFRFIFTKVGGGDNDAYIDTVSFTASDLGVNYDGGNIDDWQQFLENGNVTVEVDPDFGWPAPSFKMQGRNNRVGAIYRNINSDTSPLTTIDFEFQSPEPLGSQNLGLSVILMGSTSGVGSSIRFGKNEGATVCQEAGWTTRSSVTGEKLIDDDYFENGRYRVNIRMTRSSANAATATITAYEMPGDVLIGEGSFNFVINGGYIGFKWYTGQDDTATGYLDNIRISVTSATTGVDVGGGSGGGVGSGLDPDAATFVQYVYTYVNVLNEEGPPSPVSRVVQFPEGGSITVTLPVEATFDDPDSDLCYQDTGFPITAKRIYRTATSNNETSFLFVDEVDLDVATYSDDTLDADLGEELQTVDWDLPPEDGFGVIALPNGVTAMASKNQVCPSVINRPHAYPVAYRLNFDSNVVAIASIDTSIIVGTETYPYIILGSDPAQMSSSKLEQRQACVSRRGMVSIRNYGVVYPSPDGLVAVSGAGTLQVITDPYISRKEWQELVPESIIAFEHDDRYFGFYNTGAVEGGFMFDPRQGGNGLTFLDYSASAGFSDPLTDTLFLYIPEEDEIVAWDGAEEKLSYVWKSKVFQLPRHANFNAAQIRGVYDGNVTFKFYSNGSLVYTRTVNSDAEFVLPTNFSTTAQVSVEGTSEIRKIQFSEDMDELR